MAVIKLLCVFTELFCWGIIILELLSMFLSAGSMLLMTAFFNFILSKKKKTKFKSPPERNGNQGLTTLGATERSNSQSTFSAFAVGTGRSREGLADPDTVRVIGPEEREGIQAMLGREQTTAAEDTDRRKGWKERKLTWFRWGVEPVEREMEEIDGEAEPDTTLDTAPMITD